MKKIFSIQAIVFATLVMLNLSLPAQAQTPNDSLYQHLGAKEGIGQIVDEFIPIVLADARINRFFKDTDTKHLALLLGEQFCLLSGGPCSYSGRDMVSAHEGMGVTLAHFNALAEDLQIAMENRHIASRVANELIAKLAPMQRAIVR